jgi:hypothetical protein
MKSQSLLQLLPLLSLLPTAHSLTWTFDPSSATCDGSPFTTDSLVVTCNNSPSCTLGDTAYISGNLTATSAFDSGVYVVLQPCIVTYGDYHYCPEKYAYKAGGVCEEWLQTNDGQDCGQVGDYTVDYSIDIPNKLPEYLTWLSYASNVVTIQVKMLQERECEAEASQEGSSNGYQMVYSVLGFTAGMVCAAAYARKRKAKSEESQSEGSGVKENLGGDYIEMLSGKSDGAAVV